MSIATTTHLNFRGTARQALEFYGAVFGGEVTVATYGDFGMPAGVPGAAAAS
ncbi:VOC family protein, partial [Pseudomonas sp. BGM005]|nr:VOC family protein [Pseudomonas sp. BG5]